MFYALFREIIIFLQIAIPAKQMIRVGFHCLREDGDFAVLCQTLFTSGTFIPLFENSKCFLLFYWT